MDDEARARLRRLQEELDALKKIETQEEFDEGARLHAEHNAPWVKGQYSHLKFPPYVFQEFPKMLYSLDYEPACVALAQAHMIPGRGSEDDERSAAITVAERRKRDAIRVVKSQHEQEVARREFWYFSPNEAVEAKKRLQHDIEVAEAHRHYEDRNLGEQAKAEAEAFDEAAGDFTPVIPETPIRRGPGRPRKEVSA
jgi:hypothetical protein